MATRNTVIRGALMVVLLALAGMLGWVAWTKVSRGQGGGELVLLAALLPLAATGLLYLRRNGGGGAIAALAGTLAIVSGLLGAVVAWALSSCLFCNTQPPFSAEAVALFTVAVVVLALAVVDLTSVGLVWVAIAIAVAVLVGVAGTPGIAAAVLLVASVVVWQILKRRRSGSGSSPNRG